MRLFLTQTREECQQTNRGMNSLRSRSSVEENSTDPVVTETPPGSSPRLESHDVQEVPQAGVVGWGAGTGGRVENVQTATSGTESSHLQTRDQNQNEKIK